MNVVDYLKGVTGYPIRENSILTILLHRGIEVTADTSSLDIKTRELLMADTFMLLATLPSSSGGTVKKSGDFELREGNIVLGDRRPFIKRAMSIYKLYNDPSYDDSELGLTRWVDDEL